jgi:cystathionine beta-lyase family protein involved in aluminum resistance|tara:strand:+ start:418 stop:702 length:285 start_codon:yes stop_codon:yes gene_type:complete
MRDRVLRRRHRNGSLITVKLSRKTVTVEGTKNGIDIAAIKLKRERGWRERFQVIVDDMSRGFDQAESMRLIEAERTVKINETTIQARIPSAASC